MSRSNLPQSSGRVPDHLPSLFDNRERDNPFAIPPDEKIFTFKDEEKYKRLEEREKNAKLKIWEKNRPAREGCLRQICEEDIETTSIAINPAVQKKLNSADASNLSIPMERTRKKENRYKLIEKKREMFLIQKMHDTKKEEIQKLEDYVVLREDGLNSSEKLIDQDTKSFVDFFRKNKEESQNAVKGAEKFAAEKQKKLMELKNFQDRKNAITSQINKSIETLDEWHKYKTFLDALSPKEFLEEKKRERDYRKHQKMMSQFNLDEHDMMAIRQQLASPKTNDDAKSVGSSNAQGRPKPSNFKKTKGITSTGGVSSAFSAGASGMNTISGNAAINENNIIIPKHLEGVIDEDDDDFPLYFETPQALLEIFTGLEEQNLFLIQNTQEIEQTMEEKRHEFEQMKEKLDKKANLLKNNVKELEKGIEESTRQVEILEDLMGSNAGLGNEDEMFSDLDKKIKDIGTKPEFKSDSRLSGLQHLAEIERKIEIYFKQLEGYPKEMVDEIEKQRDRERRTNLRNLKNEMEAQLYREKLQQKSEKKNERLKFEKIGRQDMFRSQPKGKKKKKEQKVQKSQEELDRLKYLGEA